MAMKSVFPHPFQLIDVPTSPPHAVQVSTQQHPSVVKNDPSATLQSLRESTAITISFPSAAVKHEWMVAVGRLSVPAPFLSRFPFSAKATTALSLSPFERGLALMDANPLAAITIFSEILDTDPRGHAPLLARAQALFATKQYVLSYQDALQYTMVAPTDARVRLARS
jgi:hypothetical protein